MAVLLVVLVVASGGCFFLGARHAVQTLAIRRVTPDQVSNAMRDDHFYSDYNEATLVIRGTVRSLDNHGGDVVLEFSASSAYRALCDLGHVPSTPRVGETVTVVAEGAAAERQTAAVILTGCTIP